MIKIREAIVVEGKYDKNTLSQIVDAPIFQTDGFQIMKDTEKELRSLATFRNDIMKEVISARLDENVSEAEYQDYIKAANEMFKQRGLKEITCPAFAEGQLKYIREVHKAKQAAKQSTSKE